MPPKDKLISLAKNAYKLSLLTTYSQGFDLLKKASKEENWNLDLSEIARLWRGGCIIRSAVLSIFQKKYLSDELISQDTLEKIINIYKDEPQRNWRKFISIAISNGIPIPALSSSITWFDALRTEKLPQNLIQAQRDFFGAHEYERIGEEGQFHTNWNNQVK